MHRTILVVDVEGFGDESRTNPHQVAVRDGMYGALRQAFDDSGIPWDLCHTEDRGDGVFFLVPPEIPKRVFVDTLPAALVLALSAHNDAHPAPVRMRLRMAVHAGEVNYDAHGATAAAINLAFRLLDAAPLKEALADSPGMLALITSPWFFDEVVRHAPAGSPESYRQVTVQVKETTMPAWISLPDHPYPPREPEGTRLAARPSAAVVVPGNGVRHANGRAVLPSSAQFFAVVDALESIPCLRSENSRSLLVEQLRPPIASAIPYYPRRRAHVVGILRACLDYDDGLAELVTAISNMEQDGSVPLQRLLAAIKGETT